MSRLAFWFLVMCIAVACSPASAIPATSTPLPTTTAQPTSTPRPTETRTAIPIHSPTPGTTNTPAAKSPPDYVLPGVRTKYTFDQIVPLLSTPQLVSQFMLNNMKRDDAWDGKACGEVCYSPARLVYQNGVDSLHGLVTLECYFLEKNGWDAYHIGLSIENPVGTNVCGVITNGTVLILDYDGNIVGSVNSLAEVARYGISRGWMKEGGQLRTINASQITQVTTNRTTPSILGLPWALHPY